VPNASQQESIATQLAFWAGDWSALMAFWIALTGDVTLPNLGIGAAAALIGSILSVATESMNLARFAPHGRHLWDSRGVLLQIPLGAFTMLRLLLSGKRPAGRLYVTRFQPGGSIAKDQARRAVAETFPTMTPTSLVLGIDQRHRKAVLHLLGTKSIPPTIRRLRGSDR
jgi:multisubunit Na+/H+ antiporter MnhE subunit